MSFSKKPEIYAWAILLFAFVTFGLVAWLGVSGVRWYLRTATVQRSASLQVSSGTVLVKLYPKLEWVSAKSGLELHEGDAVRTDRNSNLLLTFFDGSTVRLFPDSEIRITRARQTRFTRLARTIGFWQESGRTRVGVAMSDGEKVDFRVQTRDMRATLGEGSYSMEVHLPDEGAASGSKLAVRQGRAAVESEGDAAQLRSRQKILARAGEPLGAPEPAGEDLVHNGSFTQQLDGWMAFNDQGGDGGTRDGTVHLVSAERGAAVQFARDRSLGNHCETGVVQHINRDVSDYVSLSLLADVKIDYQSLGGGGYYGFEYPVILKITYRTADGSIRDWMHGFYFANEPNYPVSQGEKIEKSVWYHYEGDLFSIDPRPVELISLSISASGWDYQSQVANIALLAE